MEKYSADRVCSKCGHAEITSSFVPKDKFRYQKGWLDNDIIQRTCSNCHYSWDELPLDAKEANDVSSR